MVECWEVFFDENLNPTAAYREACVARDNDPVEGQVHEYCDLTYSVDMVTDYGTTGHDVVRAAKTLLEKHVKEKQS